MCAGALYWSQLSRLVYAADDPHRGFKAIGGKLHPKTEVVTGVLSEEATTLLKQFFQQKKEMRKTFTLIALFLLGMNYLLSQEIDTLRGKDSLPQGIFSSKRNEKQSIL